MLGRTGICGRHPLFFVANFFASSSASAFCIDGLIRLISFTYLHIPVHRLCYRYVLLPQVSCRFRRKGFRRRTYAFLFFRPPDGIRGSDSEAGRQGRGLGQPTEGIDIWLAGEPTGFYLRLHLSDMHMCKGYSRAALSSYSSLYWWLYRISFPKFQRSNLLASFVRRTLKSKTWKPQTKRLKDEPHSLKGMVDPSREINDTWSPNQLCVNTSIDPQAISSMIYSIDGSIRESLD